MDLTDSCLKTLCSLGMVAGGFSLSLVGVPMAAGAIEILGKGGELAVDLATAQRDKLATLETRVRKSIERNWRTWLKSSESAGRNQADIEAALLGLAEALQQTRPTIADIALVRQTPNPDGTLQPGLGETLLARLNKNSVYRTSEAAAGLFRSMVDSVSVLARTDTELQPFFRAIEFEINMRAHERTHAKLDEVLRRLGTMAEQRGVPIEALRRLFVAAEMEMPDASDDELEQLVGQALDAVLARAAAPVKTLNDPTEIESAIREAREKQGRLDTEGALATLDAALAEQEDIQTSRARGMARLQHERAAILKDTFRWDEALTAFDRALALNPEDLVAAGEIGNIHVHRGSLKDAQKAFEQARSIATRSGDERNLSVSHNKIGDVLVSQGDLTAARQAFEDGLAIAETLTARDPGNSEWQRDLSISHNKIGNVLRAEGDLTGARKAFENGLAIAETLAARDPGNSEWQRDLSISHNKIGDMLVSQGDLSSARKAFEVSLAIRETLAARDPGNSTWQRDLSVSHNTIGDVLEAQGDLTGARKAFEDSLAIAETLAARDPGNSEWQRDLSVSHDRIGDVLVAQGDLSGARAAFEDSLAIRETLAARDPGNSTWQRDLSISHDRIGDVLVALGDLSGALKAFEDGLAIAKTLAARDPGNSEWQRDLWVSHNKIGDVLVAQGDLNAACKPLEDGLAIAETLVARDTGNSAWQRDLSVSHNKIGDVLRAEGDLTAARKAYEDSLAIRESLAARDPGNSAWQRDLIASFYRLAEIGDEPCTRYTEALTIARDLSDSGRLAPRDSWMIAELEERRAEACGD